MYVEALAAVNVTGARSQGLCFHGRVRTLCPQCRGELAARLAPMRPRPQFGAAPEPATAEIDLPSFRSRLVFRPFDPIPPNVTYVPLKFGDDIDLLGETKGWAVQPWSSFAPHFPKAAARPGQGSALRLVAAALEKFDDVVLEAPTGLGKSAIAKALTNLAASRGESSFLVVHKNGLLDQYKADHKDLALVKGMGTYPCAHNGGRTRCDTAPCQTRTQWKCPDLESCDYFGPNGVRDRAKDAKQALTNYDYLYYSGVVNDQFPSRDLLVLDECHRVEDTLLRNLRMTLSDSWVAGLCGRRAPKEFTKRLLEATDAEPQATVLEGAHQHVQVALAALGQPSAVSPMDRRRYQSALDRLEFLILELRHRPANWVRDTRTRAGDSEPMVDYKPITVAPYAHQLLSLGAKRVHLSATVLDHLVYLRSLGVERAAVLKVIESPFAPERRQVDCVSVAPLNKDTLDAALPKLTAAIDQILEQHVLDRGIVLPFTHKIRNAIMAAGLRNHARLVTHSEDAQERERVLKRFMGDEASNRVLVSTYAGEGMDFADDRARFCIIVKTPYPDLGDPQVRARKELDPAWYENEALKAVLQMAGRVCRSPEDFGHTYILDSNADRLLQKNRRIVPDWFWQAYRRVAVPA